MEWTQPLKILEFQSCSPLISTIVHNWIRKSLQYAFRRVATECSSNISRLAGVFLHADHHLLNRLRYRFALDIIRHIPVTTLIILPPSHLSHSSTLPHPLTSTRLSNPCSFGSVKSELTLLFPWPILSGWAVKQRCCCFTATVLQIGLPSFLIFLIFLIWLYI
ncbi:hypothetical protein BHAP_0025 [Bifidobacterium hapali]|uniref:Uncharacterized protein n=1 Tax=Bifidobacterium hapali TaxID=1630172 RepID=A0A261G659_9BIFI|nr:hypothetical protein BHAP_0025 [Bifidobacterium hapali]